LLTIYPAEYRAWAGEARSRAADAGRPSREASPAVAETVAPLAQPNDIRIANPPPGAIYSVDPTLRREFQALPLRAVTGRPTMVTWLVDGNTIGTISSERALSWPLATGPHHIEARDAAGRRTRTSIVVK
jgi:membrane carboxypeptidase/penicillin-binding protein PbpC